MSENTTSRKAVPVLMAAALVVVLTALLGARLVARAASPAAASAGAPTRVAAPAASVPEPRGIRLEELPMPFCWGCSWNQDAPLEFQVDLDLLAPLGDGPGNAAEWFRDFAAGGKRADSGGKRTYRDRLIEFEYTGQLWRVLPGNDPLLLEAEPWLDQARCRFYPDVWAPAGIGTEIPDLLMILDLARSWTVRGKMAVDASAAREDFRRVIRLGRLLRQDDVTIIQDLVGIACIAMGTEGLYERSRDEGDAVTMLLASRVLADRDALRLMTAKRLSAAEPPTGITGSGAAPAAADDEALDRVIERAHEATERRFRLEAVVSLQAVKQLGAPSHRARALAALEELADDPDRVVARAARCARDTTVDDEELRGFLEADS